MDRRSSVVEPTGGYGPDARNQLNTTTALPKPQQRAPELGQRQPRPESYDRQNQPQLQGPYGAPNRPPVQQHQQQYRPPPPQQQQQSRTPGDRASPWNLIRQTLPPEIGFRGPPLPQQQRPPPLPQQQRPPPPPSQYYNMQQQQQRPPQELQNRPQPTMQELQNRPPPTMQELQNRPPPTMQERRPTLSRIDQDRPALYRPENVGRPMAAGGGAADDDEEVVVNSSVTNQQPPPPPLNRRDSTVYAAGVRPSEAVDPNRQWNQRQSVAAAAYGKPQEQQQYGRVLENSQDQRYPAQVSNYSRPQQQQDGENANWRPTVPSNQKPRDVQQQQQQQPLTRRDSVLDATYRVQTDAGPRRNDAAQPEYGRRPPLQPRDSFQELEGGRRPPPPELRLQQGGGTQRRPLDPSYTQAENGVTRRQPAPAEDVQSGGRRLSDLRNSRPGVETVNREDTRSFVSRDYEQRQQQQQQQQPQQQQVRYIERKVSLDKDLLHDRSKGPALDRDILSLRERDERPEVQAARTSESRRTNFDNEQQQYSRTAAADGDGRTAGRPPPPRPAEDVQRPRDYAAAVQGRRPSSISENEPPNRNAAAEKVLQGSRGWDGSSQSKNTRPDTLKIIKDSEPLKDSSNSKGDHRSDDVGKSPSKIPKKDLLKTPTRAGTPKSPDGTFSANGQKKLPMNKVQVGSAPSPNLKVVRSKVGSLQNTSYKPGGGQVKIENRKLEWKAGTRVVAKNDAYVPGGGDKKIQSTKLQWNAKPKVGSLENKTHKPGGGDKKIETVKLDFKDKAKPKIGSKDNIKHTPGGGAIKIEDQKLEIKAQSKVGSLDNVKHKPGGGEVKIFDDKSYIKQTAGTPTKSQLWRSSSMQSPTSEKLYCAEERPGSQVKIIVTPTISEDDVYTKTRVDTNKSRPKRSANVRSPSPLQHNICIVVPEEEVKSKKL